MKLPLYQIDAFADALFTGNPAAVCPLETWLPDATMQRIAGENNLAETAFFVRDGTNYHIRWFTPTTEVDLCGHATVASAYVLRHYLGVPDARLRFYSKGGVLEVTHEDGWYLLNFPTDSFAPAETPPAFLQGLGATPIEAYKGRTDYMLVYEREEQIETMRPDFGLIATVPSRGVMVTAPSRAFDFVSRFFGPQSGINEDYVTGSAHTTLIPYWAQRLGKTELLAKQISSRGGVVKCRLLGDRVEIGGQAIPYLKGEIEV